MLNAKNIESKTKYERPPALEAGSYPCRVVQVIGLGLQKQEPYKGKERDPQIELYVTYEFVDEFLQDEDGKDIEDKPRWLSETFGLFSMDSDLAKSTKRMNALDSNGEIDGDWSKAPGTPAMVTINRVPRKDDEGENNYVTNVTPMRAKDAAKLPDLVNPVKVFDPDNPDMEIFMALPQWLRDKITGNLDYDGSVLQSAVEGLEGDSKGGNTKKEDKAAPEASQEVSEASESEDEVDW